MTLRDLIFVAVVVLVFVVLVAHAALWADEARATRRNWERRIVERQRKERQ